MKHYPVNVIISKIPVGGAPGKKRIEVIKRFGIEIKQFKSNAEFIEACNGIKFRTIMVWMDKENGVILDRVGKFVTLKLECLEFIADSHESCEKVQKETSDINYSKPKETSNNLTETKKYKKERTTK